MLIITVLSLLSGVILFYYHQQPTEYINITIKLYAVDSNYPHYNRQCAVLPYYQQVYHVHNDVEALTQIIQHSYQQLKFYNLLQLTISKGRPSRATRRLIKHSNQLLGFD